MKFYKDESNQVYAFSADGSQDEFIAEDLILISSEEADALRAPPPPPPVVRITALQGLLAIDSSGLAGAYETWANDPARTFAERAFLNKAQDWRRDDPILAGAATALGLTSAQVDAMFELAATL